METEEPFPWELHPVLQDISPALLRIWADGAGCGFVNGMYAAGQRLSMEELNAAAHAFVEHGFITEGPARVIHHSITDRTGGGSGGSATIVRT